MLVVDMTRYLPGAFASRELLRLGARVVRLEQPDGDPMRGVSRTWDEALNAGKESVAIDLKTELPFARALLARADVILEGFRPGVAERLGVGPDDVPGDRGLLLDHGVRDRRASRSARWSRPELPRLGGGARRHRAKPAAAPAGRPRSGRARSSNRRFSQRCWSEQTPAAARG